MRAESGSVRGGVLSVCGDGDEVCVGSTRGLFDGQWLKGEGDGE